MVSSRWKLEIETFLFSDFWKQNLVKWDIYCRYLCKQQACSHHEREVAQVNGSPCEVFALPSPCPPWLLQHFGAWRAASWVVVGTRGETVGERSRQRGQHIEEIVKSAQLSYGSTENGLVGTLLPCWWASPSQCSCQALPTLVCCLSCRQNPGVPKAETVHNMLCVGFVWQGFGSGVELQGWLLWGARSFPYVK